MTIPERQLLLPPLKRERESKPPAPRRVSSRELSAMTPAQREELRAAEEEYRRACEPELIDQLDPVFGCFDPLPVVCRMWRAPVEWALLGDNEHTDRGDILTFRRTA